MAKGLFSLWGDPSCTARAHPQPKPTGEQSLGQTGSSGLLRGECVAGIPWDGRGHSDFQCGMRRGGSPGTHSLFALG